MSTIHPDAIPYDGTTVSGRYNWWASQEIGNENPNIDTYAKLINSEFQKLLDGEVDIKQFEDNTPHIEDETPLNYIRDRIIENYPN